MTIGIYQTLPDSFGNICTVKIEVINHVIQSIIISGRSELDRDNATTNELISEVSTTTRFNVCHIVSVLLMKEYLQNRYVGKNFLSFFPNSEKILAMTPTKAANLIAATIYKEFANECSNENNLFTGNKDANVGANTVRAMLKPYLLKGKNLFSPFAEVFFQANEQYSQVLAFFKDTKDLCHYLSMVDDKGSRPGVRLTIANWQDLCLIYEHTLLDYRVLDYCPTEKQIAMIKKGQDFFDAVYENYDCDMHLRASCPSLQVKKSNYSIPAHCMEPNPRLFKRPLKTLFAPAEKLIEAGDDEDTLKIYQSRAEKLQVLEQHSSAIESYTQAIRLFMKLHPNSSELANAFENRGDCYVYLEDYDNAYQDYDACFSITQDAKIAQKIDDLYSPTQEGNNLGKPG